MESDLGRLLTQNSGQRQRYERLQSEVEAKLREVQETISVRETKASTPPRRSSKTRWIGD